MRPLRHRRRGTALVITVGLLAVLAVIGFGFAVLARLHHDTSRYYRAAAQNDLIAHAAIQYALGELRYCYAHAPTGAAADYSTPQLGAVAEPVSGPPAPWFVDPTIAARGYKGTDGKTRYCNLRCNSYALVHDDLGSRIGVSMVKVLDCAGKLNVNDHYDTDDARLKTLLTNLITKLGLSATVSADAIVTARNALSNNALQKRFTSLEQVRTEAGIDARSFQILRHYITVYSWPHQLPVTSGFPYTVEPNTADATLTLNPSNSTAGSEKLWVRSPIDLNTAGKELLYALLISLKDASDVQLLGSGAAEDTAKWMVRKRAPQNADLWDGSQPSSWTDWSDTTKNATFKDVLQRKLTGWRNYPIGPFDTWNEVVDFLYCLARNTEESPYDSGVLTTDKAEAILAATCPNAFAAGLVGHNTYTLGYAHLKKDATALQALRDKDTDAVAPEIIGKNQMPVAGTTHPFCFSSMGRFEIYSRTYTFLKADQGTVSGVATGTDKEYKLADTSKTWSASPNQWRGYSVLIYDGRGKGKLRGIIQVEDSGNGTGNTLYTDRWGNADDELPDSTSRYCILGPGPLLDRVPGSAGAGEVTANPGGGDAGTLADTKGTWEDGQWDGHRIVLYRGHITVGGGPNGEDIENIYPDTIQERTIIATRKSDTRLTTPSLVVAPDFDTTLLTGGVAGDYFAYMILGCDGAVARTAAVKAYDVIHHTTQKDFEDGRTAGDSARVATGPNNVEAQGVGAASDIDGWITAREEDATDSQGLLVNFTKASLAPDDSGKGSLVGSTPAVAEITKDALQGGRLLSDGLLLRGGSGDYVGYKLTGDFLKTDRAEGGFASIWYRPEEAFFSGTHTILEIVGKKETTKEDKISLRVDSVGGVRSLILEVCSQTGRQYEEMINDAKHGSGTIRISYKAQTTTYSEKEASPGTKNYSDVSNWKPGEWHHIALAWYECVNDLETQVPPSAGWTAAWDSDSDPATDWRDDSPATPDNILDDDVFGRVRLWVDGQTLAVDDRNKVPAFNFHPPDATTAPVRLSGDGAGTVDCLVAYRLTDTLLNVTVPSAPNNPRYDGYVSADPPTTPYSHYVSPTVTISNPGKDRITLGSVAWTGFLPWMKDGEHWGGPGGASLSALFPMRVEVALDSAWSASLPRDSARALDRPCFGGGGWLRDGSDNLIEKSDALSVTVKYKVYFLPFHGDDYAEDAAKGLIRGRQAPILDDITITLLGPVQFYYWK